VVIQLKNILKKMVAIDNALLYLNVNTVVQIHATNVMAKYFMEIA